jgi:hypothetical protein
LKGGTQITDIAGVLAEPATMPSLSSIFEDELSAPRRDRAGLPAVLTVRATQTHIEAAPPNG